MPPIDLKPRAAQLALSRLKELHDSLKRQQRPANKTIKPRTTIYQKLIFGQEKHQPGIYEL